MNGGRAHNAGDPNLCLLAQRAIVGGTARRPPPAAARAAIAFVKLRMDWNMSSQLCTSIVSYTDLATHGRVWNLNLT